MKHLFTAAALLLSMTALAQVGINNTSPKATLDITAKTTDGSKPEGLIIPKLSGDNIHTATANAVYGAAQKGLIVYASSADTNPTGATANITAAGYYYFDGGAWQKVMTGSLANADLAAGVGGIYKGSGSLSGNTTVTQGASTLAFTSTATNGFSVDGTTLSVDAANNRVGIGTTTPSAMLHVYGTSGDHIRLTNSASDWALGSENAGGQNGIPGQSSFNITDRVNGVRRMTIGVDNSFRLGGNIAVGNAALSIDGPTNKVGIGINVPNATLDVKAASNGSTPEGIIAPRLSLTALQLYTYTSAQTGAIVYVNSASGTPTGQTANVTAVGYYYFDGTNWQKVANGASVTDATTSTKGIVQLAGDLTGTAASPSIAGNAVTSAKIADGTVANTDLANMAALTVKGNATNASAVPTDIAAGTDGHVLRRSGTTLGFGTVATAGITDGAVTASKINQMSAISGQVLGWNGTAWAPTTSDTTNDAWINDTTNGLVKLGTKADGTARAAGTDFVAKDNGQIGIGTTSPNASAALDITASNKGLLIPRVALTSTIDQTTVASPANGLMVYNTATTTGANAVDSNYMYIWNGNSWAKLATSSDATFIPITSLVRRSNTNQVTYESSGVANLNTQISQISDGNWNSTTNTYTITSDGTYQFSLSESVIYSSVTTFSHAAGVLVAGNFYQLISRNGQWQGLPNTGDNYSGTLVLYLTAGTTIRPSYQNCACNYGMTYTLKNVVFSAIKLSN
ncbi:hypothetical protein SAMN05421846_10423 [Chryseobacterium taeanense]|uniref:C1q domain-containing protein n=1 Tax=Chryseobacterium taeanense TaxID=311334 RepID=A0A1G8HPB1_9FLAO|nr:hypothetical protein [Chryseobacterium taeanense]SDI08497.1 hypothetical protein SAMN05421846_10423 [Chryseobacterium taeanense]